MHWVLTFTLSYLDFCMGVCDALLWVMLFCTPLYFYWDFLETIFHREGSCNWAKYPLVHSLPCPGTHLRSFIEGVPLDARLSCA